MHVACSGHIIFFESAFMECAVVVKKYYHVWGISHTPIVYQPLLKCVADAASRAIHTVVAYLSRHRICMGMAV